LGPSDIRVHFESHYNINIFNDARVHFEQRRVRVSNNFDYLVKGDGAFLMHLFLDFLVKVLDVLVKN
jgi:hypothetical protein